MSPKTIHGWRPTSVKIQPKRVGEDGQERSGDGGISSQRCVGARPLRVSHSTASAMAAAAMPSPIMRRNVQYVVGMLGT